MSEELKKIEVITVDGVQYNVADMSEEVQKIVAVFDRWNAKDANVQDEIATVTKEAQGQLNELADNLAMIRAAKDTLSRQILEKIKEDASKADEGQTDVVEVTKEGSE